MNTIKIEHKQAKIIAHRGLSGLEKENTCSAFVAAGNREAYYGIETDVHRTADGKYIIFHDDDTARVGVDSMIIENSTFETLRKLQLTDIDGKRGRIDLLMPELLEYIRICQKYEKVAVLELKNAFRPEEVWEIVSLIETTGYLPQVTFISFELCNLIALREKYPTQPAQYLLDNWGADSQAILARYNLGLDIDYTAVTPEVVAAVHAIGQEINCWTCNTREEGEALIAMGVDYITSNILE